MTSALKFSEARLDCVITLSSPRDCAENRIDTLCVRQVVKIICELQRPYLMPEAISAIDVLGPPELSVVSIVSSNRGMDAIHILVRPGISQVMTQYEIRQ